jgi:hypothetical protein
MDDNYVAPRRLGGSPHADHASGKLVGRHLSSFPADLAVPDLADESMPAAATGSTGACPRTSSSPTPALRRRTGRGPQELPGLPCPRPGKASLRSPRPQPIRSASSTPQQPLLAFGEARRTRAFARMSIRPASLTLSSARRPRPVPRTILRRRASCLRGDGRGSPRSGSKRRRRTTGRKRTSSTCGRAREIVA